MPKRKKTEHPAQDAFIDDDYPYWSRTEQHKEIVSDIISNGRYSIAGLAPYFECSPQAMRTKFSRGSFSVDDIVLLMCLSGLHLKIYKGNECVQEFEPSVYVRNDKEMWAAFSKQKRHEQDEFRKKMAEAYEEVESARKKAAEEAERKAKKTQNTSNP